MNIEERREFVRSHRTCVYGYNRRNDGPSMSMVYYLMEPNDDILIITMEERGKARAARRNAKASICVLDEKWPPTYVQVYCDASVDATMATDPKAVVSAMMRLYELMAGQPMPEAVRANAEETCRREKRTILRLRPYATFETPPRHVRTAQDTAGLTHWLGELLPWR